MPATFQLVASHPALDFVNTLDNRFVAAGAIELMRDYADLLGFAEQTKLLDARQIGLLRRRHGAAPAAKALRRARNLREALAIVFYAAADGRTPPPGAWKALQRYCAETRRHQELVWPRQPGRAGTGSHASWSWGRFESDLQLPVWAVAQSAMELLTSADMEHLHACSSQTCRWLFLDTSKNHSRRWCDMKLCGNRMKARRFQARH